MWPLPFTSGLWLIHLAFGFHIWPLAFYIWPTTLKSGICVSNLALWNAEARGIYRKPVLMAKGCVNATSPTPKTHILISDAVAILLDIACVKYIYININKIKLFTHNQLRYLGSNNFVFPSIKADGCSTRFLQPFWNICYRLSPHRIWYVYQWFSNEPRGSCCRYTTTSWSNRRRGGTI